MAVAPDGSIYYGRRNGRFVVDRWFPNGTVIRVAGTGAFGSTGDGGPATLATIQVQHVGIALGPDGNLYIRDRTCVRVVYPNGIIDTFAGNCNAGGLPPNTGDGGRALSALMGATFLDIPAVGPDGSVYFGSYQFVRRVTPDGIIRAFAGGGPGGDGVAATSAALFSTGSATNRMVAVAPGGDVYIKDACRIRRVGVDGVITTAVGTGACGFSGDGGLAVRAQIQSEDETPISVTPDHALYLLDRDPGATTRVRRVEPAQPGLGNTDLVIPDEAGGTAYVFNSAGQHLRTLDLLTSAERANFSYDENGRLASVIDGNGNTTIIQRDGAGGPTAIVGPFGHFTALTIGADDFLASIVNPASETQTFTYHPGGLMASRTDARNHTYAYSYDPVGRLLRGDDPAGGFRDRREDSGRPLGAA
jgi:YD repeat-containing protein